MKWEWKDDASALIVPLALAIVTLCLFASPAKATDPRKRAVYSATPCMKWKRTLRLRAQERLHAKRSNR